MTCFRCGQDTAPGQDACGTHYGLWKAWQDIAPRIRSAADYLTTEEDTPTNWVWGMPEAGLMAEGDFVGIGAFSGDGKTALIFGLCAALSKGGSFIGQPTRGPLSSLIITETGARQVKKLLRHNESALDAARITIVQSTRISHEVFSYLLDIYRPDVLCIDSLTAIAPALKLHGQADFDWQTPTHMTAVSLWLREAQQQHGIKLMIGTAHTTKNSRRSDAGPPSLEHFRGTGALVEQLDQAYLYRRSRGGKEGGLFNVKSRAVDETMKHLRFHYDEDTGLYFEAVPDSGAAPGPDVSAAEIVDSVKKGNRTSSRIADHLRRNKSGVCRRVDEMLRTGALTRATKSRNLYAAGETG